MSNLKSAEFWAMMSRKFSELGSQYPDLRSAKKVDGQWVFPGASQEAIEKYKLLAERAGKACGFVGNREQCLQYWLNRVEAYERIGK